MKISYRIDKKSLGKHQELEGIRKATEPAPEVISRSQKMNTKKPFDLARVILASILLFLIEILVLYVANVPVVRWPLDNLKNPTGVVPKVAYNTIKLQIATEIPESIKNQIQIKLQDIAFENKKRFEFVTENPDVLITYSSTKKDSDKVLLESMLVPVGHLYWVRDSVTKGNVQQDEILVPTGKKTMYSKILSQYAGKEVKVTEVNDLVASLKSQEKAVGFNDFFSLSGQYKLLTLDGKLFFEDAPAGGIPYYLLLTGDSSVGKDVLIARTQGAIPESFDKASLLSLRMTGVTAITRSLGIKTNASGDPGYAARKIGDFLSRADLTHVSNEISITPNCQPAGGVNFCMVASHIEALKKSGVDIVELTGNHNNDKGSAYNTSTIKTYQKLGWSYFGGGLDSTDSKKILYKDVKGTKLAFLGYNYYDSTVGSPGALATASHSGANAWSPTKVKADVAEAKKHADIVIVDFQYQECWSYTDDGSTVQSCYSPLSGPDQRKDFRYAIDVGADIVVGTQAHQPQTYEIYKGKSIFYGLGNLFFDQTQQLGTRQGLILTHYFYKGQYLGTNITTTLFNSDLLTYITTGKDRSSFLTSLKNAR